MPHEPRSGVIFTAQPAPPDSARRSDATPRKAQARLIELGSPAKEQARLHHQTEEQTRLDNLEPGDIVLLLAKDGQWRYAKLHAKKPEGLEFVIAPEEAGGAPPATRLVKTRLLLDYVRLVAGGLCDTSTRLPDCPGVSLAALWYIRDTYNVAADATTASVIRDVIKPATQFRRELYAAVLTRRMGVSTSTFFGSTVMDKISHREQTAAIVVGLVCSFLSLISATVMAAILLTDLDARGQARQRMLVSHPLLLLKSSLVALGYVWNRLGVSCAMGASRRNNICSIQHR